MEQQGIYKNPIFLNSVTHKSVKVAPVTEYKFAGQLNSVVIVGQEFLEAAKFYPVVFTKGQNDEIIPVALLGLRNSENLFIDDKGKWREGSYIPAFFRRYPFILASNVGQDGSFAVCVDSSYEGKEKSCIGNYRIDEYRSHRDRKDKRPAWPKRKDVDYPVRGFF